MKIALYKQAGVMEYSFLINEKDDFTIPNSGQSIGKYQLENEQLEGYLLIQEDNIAARKNDVMLIGVYNDDSDSAIAQISLEAYGIEMLFTQIIIFLDDASVIRTVSIYLMIGISVALLLVWVGISGFKCKLRTKKGFNVNR